MIAVEKLMITLAVLAAISVSGHAAEKEALSETLSKAEVVTDWRIIAGCEKFIRPGSSQAWVLHTLGKPSAMAKDVWVYATHGDPVATARIEFVGGKVKTVSSSWAPHCK